MFKTVLHTSRLLALLMILLQPVQSTVLFELKNSCVVSKDRLFLQDLVKNITLPKEYAEIPLGLAPFKKNERVIDADFIRETLIRQQKTAYLPSGGSVTVANRTAVLTAKEQEKMITAAVDSLLKNENYKLEFRSACKDVVYPVRDKIAIELLDKNRARFSGNQLYQIEIKLNDRTYTKININGFIRIYRPVFLATVKIGKNSLIENGDLTTAEKEVTGFENELIVSAAELGGYKAGRLIPEGTILRKSYLIPLPVVKRGEIVKLTAKDEQVEIILPATALSDGLTGQTTKFKINATEAVVQAEITGPGQAELRR